jgi:hypothetical protein
MVDLGRAHGVVTRALLTDMNTPLGLAPGTRSRSRSRWRCWPAAARRTSSS